LAACPGPEGLPARRVRCRLTPVPLPWPIMCLYDPASPAPGARPPRWRKIGRVVTNIFAPHVFRHHRRLTFVTTPLYIGRGPRTTCFPACVLVPQIPALQSGCPPCRITRGPPLWRPPTGPTVLVPSHSVGLPPIGRAPPPRSTTPNVGGCRLTICQHSSLPLALSGTIPLDGVLNGSASLRPPLSLRPFPPPPPTPPPPPLFQKKKFF